MTSSKPYILRALHEWLSDNGLTPHVLVDATVEEVNVPESAISENRVILNVDWQAVRELQLDNEFVSFSARFSGVPHMVYLPMSSILAIYARENGQGMMFSPEEDDLAASSAPPVVDETEDPEKETVEQDAAKKPSGPPSLRVIK